MINVNSKSIKKYDFIYVGRIDKRKCVDLIIKALKILKDKNYNFSAVIIGSGPWYTDIKKLIKNHGLDRYVLLTGFLPSYEDVLRYITKSKFLILPSSYESDPLVIKEALSLGVPCIVSDIPALTAIIKDGENGFVFRRYSCTNLAKCMEKALKLSKGEYQRFSKNAKKSIENRNWVNIAKEYIKIFTKVVKRYDRQK